MPKQLDEDQARRKAALAEKRAARKEAARQANLQTQEQSESKSASDNTSKLHTTPQENANRRPYLLELPEDAMATLTSLLPAADLCRLTSMTCKQLQSYFVTSKDARVACLLARLHVVVQNNKQQQQRTCTTIDLCKDEAQAKLLLQNIVEVPFAAGVAERSNKRKGTVDAAAITTISTFCSYARFLDEAVAGFTQLDRLDSNNKNPLHLTPLVLQGRVASCSPEHSLCRVGGHTRTVSGAGGSGVASWGVGRRGQLGHGQRQDERFPRLLAAPIGYGVRIVQVSAGGGLVRVAHSLLLTSTGRVLSFGCGQYGALGHGYSAAKQLPDALRPQYVEGPLAGVICTCVAAGELHSAVVTSDGDLFTWGDGFCGQLGHGDKRPQTTPKQVTLGGLEDENVASVVCGSRHTLVVTEDGEAYSFGLGHFGVLGRSFTPFDYDADAAVVAFNNDVRADAGDPVVANGDAVAPQQPAAAVIVEAAGERDFAAELVAHLDLIANLTLDDSSDQCIPKRIDSLAGITIIGASAGHRHSLLLDSNGSLYSFGAGNAGCLGHGDTLKQMHPMKIRVFEEDEKNVVRVIQMSAGVDMSMAVSATGDVYAWGKTDGGRIGLGLGRSQVTLPRRVPLKATNGQDVKAVDVECGYVHSLVVGLDGSIHLCGGVGINGAADGQEEDREREESAGKPRQVPSFNIWQPIPEPKDSVSKERWKKYGKYEVKGRSKMMASTIN